MTFLVVGCGGGHRPRRPSNSSETSSQTQSESSSSSSKTSSSINSESSSDSSSSSTAPSTTHLVTFYNEGVIYGNPVTVSHGGQVPRPAIDPTKESDAQYDYVFEAWYSSITNEPYDFNTPVFIDLTLYSVFAQVEKENPYDLVVYIHGNSGATSYISEEESNRVLSEFKKQEGVSAQAKISWNYMTNLNVASFSEVAVHGNYPADIVIAGNNISTYIPCDTTYEKVIVGEGWFENTTRRVAITQNCLPTHKGLAITLYNMLKNTGPSYGINFSANALSLRVQQSLSLTLICYEGTPTIELINLNPAGCFSYDGSYVTGLYPGTGVIKATAPSGGFAECAITVLEKTEDTTYDLVLAIYTSNEYVNYMLAEDAQRLVDRFASTGQPGEGKNIKLHIIEKTAVNTITSCIQTINNENDAQRVDALISYSSYFSDANRLPLLETYSLVDVHPTWKYNTGVYGIFQDAVQEHVALAQLFGEYVSAQNVDYFELETSIISLYENETYQVQNTKEGMTFASSNTSIMTVNGSGLITALNAGIAKLTISINAYYATINVIIKTTDTSANTLNIFINNAGSSTVYMSTENVALFENAIQNIVSNDITINWYVIDGREMPDNGRTNAVFASYILGLTDIVPDILVCGSGAIGNSSVIPAHAEMPKIKITSYCDNSTRYVAGYANLPVEHLPAALEVYNAIISIQPAQ